MRPTTSKIRVLASAAAASLGLTACAASAPSIEEANASADAALATCSTASITVDRRTKYQAPIAGFLEEARTSGCDYDGIQIAQAPDSEEKAENYAEAVAVARDFVDAFALSWRLEPEAHDQSLSANSLRVTLLAPHEELASAQGSEARYR